MWGARLRHFDVKLIVLHSTEWEMTVRSAFPACPIRIWNKSINASLPSEPVDFCLTDVDLSARHFQSIWDAVKLAVVSTRSQRRNPSGWRHGHFALFHHQCGGVTDGSWDFNLYSRRSINSFSIQPEASRTLICMLDSKGSPGGVPCSPPFKVRLRVPQLLPLRPFTYHCEGLFPWNQRRCLIVAPSCHSKTGWSRRRLSGSEMLRVLDVPLSVEPLLCSAQIKSICNDVSFTPIKCILAFMDSLLRLFSLEPSGFLASVVSSHSPPIAVMTPAFNSDPLPQPDHTTATARKQKAVKADNAAVPVELWNSRIHFPPIPIILQCLKTAFLDGLRTLALRWWRRNTLRSFLHWFKCTHLGPTAPSITTSTVQHIITQFSLHRDWIAGRDCIRRAAGATWWEWDLGSRPFFWRWPSEYAVSIRDGLRLWRTGPLPRWYHPQPYEKDVQLRNQVTKKLHTVQERGYIAPGTVKSLTSYFPVPKGPDDIRMVYDGTKCGLNHVVWAPWFALPTIEEHLRAVTVGTYMADLDVSEQFLNFILSEDLQPYAGVDLTPYFGSSSKVWERWTRCFMGFTASPFCAAQGMMHAEEFVKGDPSSPSNAFRYDSVVLNLPGQRNYRPHLPWVFKSRLDGAIACDLFIHVDDSRTTGPSEEECWAAS